MTRVDSLVPLMHHDLSDCGSLILIQITPKECTLNFTFKNLLDETEREIHSKLKQQQKYFLKIAVKSITGVITWQLKVLKEVNYVI